MRRPFIVKHTKRNIALAALLALLCVGIAELTACRYFAPEVYERIVSPVRYAAGVTVDAGRAALDAGHAALDAAGQFCLDAASAVGRFAAETGAKAAALWNDLTAPEPRPEKFHPSGESDPDLTVPPTTPPLTELVQVDGKEILTGGFVDITYYYQAGEKWADQPYGTDTIGPYGCGPTVMAMAVSSMTDADTDPAYMADWAVQHGYWARGSGSYHSIVMGTAQDFGMKAESFPSRDADDMRAALWQGKLLVALVGPGHFTKGGHFILIRGVTLTGEVLVADPNSPERSLMLWDPQIILDELSSARDHGAPLWVLSPPDP